jgi:hypothetical protein
MLQAAAYAGCITRAAERILTPSIWQLAKLSKRLLCANIAITVLLPLHVSVMLWH